MSYLRIRRLVEAARKIADPRDPLGIRARELLPESTGLSRQGVEWALTRCLETRPTEKELRQLSASVPTAPRAHVILSANVFVAAHRAIALALAASPRVCVRTSRREPQFARLLCQASDGLFEISDHEEASGMRCEPGDHVWVYGTHASIESIRRILPSGAVLHAHGPGIGVAVIQPPDASLSAWMHDTASKLAEDIIVFDQRGCASPRICAVIAAPELARQFAERVAEELRRLQEQVPRGRLSETETADRLRYRDTLAYAAELLGDDTGFVSVQTDTPALVVPPVGRAIHIVRAESALVLLPLSENIVAVGVAGPAYLAKEMAAAFPRARVSALGGMQSPPLDGALDRRADPMAKP